MRHNLPIGIFDSGVGGLTVFKEIRRLLPAEDVIYFGDTGRTPYGNRSQAQIQSFTGEILDFMEQKQVKLAVAACNTITVNLGSLADHCTFQVIGMSRGVDSALKSSKNNKIGVIATAATIDSGRHCAEMTARQPGVQVFPTACPQFAQLVENEEFNSAVLNDYARQYLTPLKQAGVDTVVLGCTHYPMIIPAIANVLDGVTLIDPAVETATMAKAALAQAGLLKQDGKGYNKLYFSGHLTRAERIVATMHDLSQCQCHYFPLTVSSATKACSQDNERGA